MGPIAGPSDGIARIGAIATRKAPGSPATIVGAPTVQTIRLRALTPGTRIVDLAEGRPWEDGRPPLETFSFTLAVR